MRVREHEAGGAERRHEDRVVTEEPLEVRLAWPGAEARRVWVTMRTPGHDFELAAGFLVHEGLAGPAQVRGVAYCTDVELTPEQQLNVVTVTLDGPVDVPARSTAVSAGSAACGVCGKDSLDDVLRMPRAERWPGPVPSSDVVRRLPEALRSRQTVFARTGGVHAAGLADADGEVLVVREDVGRHNAVDKVVGSRLLADQDVPPVRVLSGRVGFELVQKAVAVGTGALVAVGAPSSLAVRLAQESGLALYGFTQPDRCVQYA